MLELPHPYLLFLGDTSEPGYAKTAFGLRDWAGEKCIGELACAPGAISLSLPADFRASGQTGIMIARA